VATPEPLEIYRARVTLGRCRDVGPVVLCAGEKDGWVKAAPLSAALDLYRPGAHFLLRPDEPDFKATGLQRTCYVNGDEVHDLAVSGLLKRLGRLEGDLATAFQEWAG